jgi:hypothetical protein
MSINNEADGKYFNDWLNTNTDFVGVTYADIVTVYFDSEPTQTIKDDVSNTYSGLTASQVLQSAIIKERYEQFQKDGVEYFNDIRATLVIDYENNVLTANDVYEIETKLEPAISKILRGDWMTGQNEMIGVTASGALTQTFLDDINNYINNYVTNNY